MKKHLFLILFSSLIWSCGSGGGDTPPPPPVNNAPTVPTLTSPTAGKLCIDNVLNFQWNASTDPDGDAISYQIQIATNAQFSPLIHDVTAATTNKTLTLEKGIAYYWRVKAIDAKNLSSAYSTTFSFYTEGVGISNHLPFTPVLVAPVLNSIVSGVANVDLQWTGSDADVSDVLTYDVYFDTVNPPVTMVGAGNQSPSTLNVPLSPLTDYFWKVVVKDNKGGQTIGQVWNFKTD